MSAATWIACSGAVIAAGAAGGLFYINEHRPHPAPPRVELACPAPVVNVAAPKPYVCTPAQAEAGECLPLITPPPVQSKITSAPAPARARAPARKKPAVSARAKLKSKWSRPDE